MASEAVTKLLIGTSAALGSRLGVSPSGVLAFASSISDAGMEPTCIRCRIEDVTAETAEQLSDVLLSFGAQSVVVDEHRPPGAPEQELFGAESAQLWDRCNVVAHFGLEHDVEATLATARDILEQPSLAVTLEPVVNEEWVEQIKASYVPLRISDRLYIVPEWSEPEDPTAVNIILQPGVAFGTGEHPTTRLCLEYLVEQQQLLQGVQVLDYGAGSGVLAIAALMLGAREAVGTDVDPLSVKAAAQNAQLSGVAQRFTSLRCAPTLDGPDPLDQLQHTTGDGSSGSSGSSSSSSSSRGGSSGDEASGSGRGTAGGQQQQLQQFELVLANILRGPLVELAPRLAGYVKPGGRLVVSGILQDQAPDIMAAYEGQGFSNFAMRTEGSWALVTATRS